MINPCAREVEKWPDKNEKQRGKNQENRAAALDYMAQQLPTLIGDEKENVEIALHAHPRPVSITFTSLIAGNDEVLYRSKAMYVWWMLRDMLGDSVLQHALAKYRASAAQT